MGDDGAAHWDVGVVAGNDDAGFGGHGGGLSDCRCGLVCGYDSKVEGAITKWFSKKVWCADEAFPCRPNANDCFW
jgi:hypothetical protein